MVRCAECIGVEIEGQSESGVAVCAHPVLFEQFEIFAHKLDAFDLVQRQRKGFRLECVLFAGSIPFVNLKGVVSTVHSFDLFTLLSFRAFCIGIKCNARCHVRVQSVN